jgi:hypothetical protein
MRPGRLVCVLMQFSHLLLNLLIFFLRLPCGRKPLRGKASCRLGFCLQNFGLAKLGRFENRSTLEFLQTQPSFVCVDLVYARYGPVPSGESCILAAACVNLRTQNVRPRTRRIVFHRICRGEFPLWLCLHKMLAA